MKKAISISVIAAMLFTGCSTTDFQNHVGNNIGKYSGTAIGAGVGAVIGKQVAGKEGLIVGALIGGTIGYFIGEDIDKRRQELERIAKESNIEIKFQDIQDKDGDKIGQAFIAEDKSQFKTGSSYLNRNSKTYFEKFAKQYAGTNQKVLIIGHTDDRGSDLSNQGLSERRAKSVANLFKSKGVDPKNIYFYGVGENQPLVSNKTSSGRGKNRRVEIVEAPSASDIAKYAYNKKIQSDLLSKDKKVKKSKVINKVTKVASVPKNAIPNKKLLDDMAKKNSLDKNKVDKNATANKKETSGGFFDKLGGMFANKDEKNKISASNVPNKTGAVASVGARNGSSKESSGSGSLKNLNGNPINSAITMGEGENKVNYYGTGLYDPRSVQCNEDFLFTPVSAKEKIVFKDGEKFNKKNSLDEFEKIVGLPIQNSDFSIISKAHASTDTAFSSTCLEDDVKASGAITNLASGKKISIDSTLDEIPWLNGTMWYAKDGNKTINITPISISVENVVPTGCPSVAITKDNQEYPKYGTSTKVLTRQGDRGFIYRIYPEISNNNSAFECIDIAFSDLQSLKAKGNLYYKKGSSYYKKELTFNMLEN